MLGETHENVSCKGGADGAIDLTVMGGTSPFTYNWDNISGGSQPQDIEDPSGLAAGTSTAVGSIPRSEAASGGSTCRRAFSSPPGWTRK